MPRTARAIVAGHCYHVLNRGNNRAERFHDHADYNQFLWLMAEASDRFPLPLIGACLMPNHVHFIVQPRQDDDLSRWMHLLFSSYSRLYHRKNDTTGRVWENRFKAFAIQGDQHLLIALRYVERNAMRSNLTRRAELWDWSSLNWRLRKNSPLALEPCPVGLPSDWVALVNRPQTEGELAAIRNCVNRQCPFGTPEWAAAKAAEFGIEQTLAPIGRPRRNK